MALVERLVSVEFFKEIAMTQMLSLIVLLFATPALADYEQPSYELVLQQDKLEIRDYAPAMVVETQVLASRRDAAGDAFRSLFKYISGSNEASLEIPMTSPVAQTQTNRDESGAANKWAIRFFLPGDMSAKDIPQPTMNGVTIVKLEAQRYASVSFRGTQNDKKVATNLTKLKSFIGAQGYDVSGPPVYAFYDPPFIPWFLRDNEILLPIENAR
jgi:hypothetical protein